MRKLLTLDDLVRFCGEHNLTSFNSEEQGKKIYVQVPATFEKEDEESSLLLYANVRAFHTGKNRNGSSVTEEAAKKAMKSMAYKPILANFTIDNDGNADFTSHDMDIDDEGNVIYLEHQIGCFTADEPYFEEDPENKDRKYVMARAAIPREYTEAANIIERKNGTKVSVELCVNELSYDAKEKLLILKDVEVSGLTLLGVNPETGNNVEEGMEGSRLDIEDFTYHTQFESNEKTLDMMRELKETLDNYISVMSDQKSKKGGEIQMEIFEENVEVTEAAEEAVEETATEESTEEVTVTEAESEETTEVTPSEEEFEAENENENEEEVEEPVEEKHSLTIEYAVSVSEMLSALTNLVNETYSGDGTYYMVDCFEDTKELVMIDMWSGSAFRQKYAVKKDVYSLKGDRIAVKARYLSADEEAMFDELRAKYEACEAKLAQYEAEPEKIELLNSDEYAQIRETAEYEEVAKRENYFELDKEELSKKLDEILLNYAKQNKIEFSADEPAEKKSVGTKMLPFNTAKKKAGRYGSIFSK